MSISTLSLVFGVPGPGPVILPSSLFATSLQSPPTFDFTTTVTSIDLSTLKITVTATESQTSASSIPAVPSIDPSASEVTGPQTSSLRTNSSVSNPSSSASRSPPLGPMIGGIVAAFAVLSLCILCIILFFKRRSSRRDHHFCIEDSLAMDSTPFIRENSGGYPSVDDEPRLSSSPMISLTDASVHSSQITPPANSIAGDSYVLNPFLAPQEKPDVRTSYTMHPPNDATREERASYAISNPHETQLQTAFTNVPTVSDCSECSLPPAYDSLSARTSHIHFSQRPASLVLEE